MKSFRNAQEARDLLSQTFSNAELTRISLDVVAGALHQIDPALEDEWFDIHDELSDAYAEADLNSKEITAARDFVRVLFGLQDDYRYSTAAGNIYAGRA